MMDRLPPKANLRPAEIAAYLDVSVSTVYELLSIGTIPSIKIGRQLRVPREEFQRWFRDHQICAA